MNDTNSQKLYNHAKREDWSAAEKLLNTLASLEHSSLDSGKLMLLPTTKDPSQNTPLHLAVESNAPPQIIRQLLKVLDPTCFEPNKWWHTPLHISAECGLGDADHVETLRHLIMAYPSAVNMADRRGQTPIDLLLERMADEEEEFLSQDQAAELIPMLVRAWSKKSSKTTATNQSPTNNETPLHKACALQNLPLYIFQLMIEEDPSMILETDSQDCTPLHLASMNDDDDSVERVKLLCKFNPNKKDSNDKRNPLQVRDKLGRTPLHSAIFWFSSTELIRTLVKACPPSIHIRDKQNHTPVQVFCDINELTGGDPEDEYVRNVTETARALVNKGKSGGAGAISSKELHNALEIENCPTDLIRLFVRRYPQQASQKDKNGNLPLHKFATAKLSPQGSSSGQNTENIIRELVEAYPFATRIPDSNGILPLGLFISSGRYTWNDGLRYIFASHPGAVVDQGLDSFSMNTLLSKLGKQLSSTMLFQLLQNAPYLVERHDGVPEENVPSNMKMTTGGIKQLDPPGTRKAMREEDIIDQIKETDESHHDETTKLNKELHSVHSQLIRVQAELKTCKAGNAALRSKLENAEKNNIADAAATNLEHEKSLRRKLEFELETFKTQSDSHLSEIDRLYEVMATLMEENENLKQESISNINEQEKLSQQLEACRAENASLKNEVTSSKDDAKNKRVLQELETSKAENVTLCTKIKEMEDKIKTAEQSQAETVGRPSTLNDDLLLRTKLELEVEDLRRIVASAADERYILLARCSVKEKENSQLQKDLEDALKIKEEYEILKKETEVEKERIQHQEDPQDTLKIKKECEQLQKNEHNRNDSDDCDTTANSTISRNSTFSEESSSSEDKSTVMSSPRSSSGSGVMKETLFQTIMLLKSDSLEEDVTVDDDENEVDILLDTTELQDLPISNKFESTLVDSWKRRAESRVAQRDDWKEKCLSLENEIRKLQEELLAAALHQTENKLLQKEIKFMTKRYKRPKLRSIKEEKERKRRIKANIDRSN